MVTLHVSVWVEIFPCSILQRFLRVTLHVSVWVEICGIAENIKGIASRSTWACELKSIFNICSFTSLLVTLHVSVWVEIHDRTRSMAFSFVTLHVSVWVEIQKRASNHDDKGSRSTWACELKCKSCIQLNKNGLSRSTWACELKFFISQKFGNWIKSRSTWACELKSFLYSVGRFSKWSRSTWACELKSLTLLLIQKFHSHAPRERVSWNYCIYIITYNNPGSRSTWACELKLKYFKFSSIFFCHAPRERVSWNFCSTLDFLFLLVTLHVSVWVEIYCIFLVHFQVTGHAPRERVSWNVH